MPFSWRKNDGSSTLSVPCDEPMAVKYAGHEIAVPSDASFATVYGFVVFFGSRSCALGSDAFAIAVSTRITVAASVVAVAASSPTSCSSRAACALKSSRSCLDFASLRV